MWIFLMQNTWIFTLWELCSWLSTASRQIGSVSGATWLGHKCFQHFGFQSVSDFVVADKRLGTSGIRHMPNILTIMMKSRWLDPQNWTLFSFLHTQLRHQSDNDYARSGASPSSSLFPSLNRHKEPSWTRLWLCFLCRCRVKVKCALGVPHAMLTPQW